MSPPSMFEVLSAHKAICTDCLAVHTRLRTEDIVRELEHRRMAPKEGECAACGWAAPVYSLG